MIESLPLHAGFFRDSAVGHRLELHGVLLLNFHLKTGLQKIGQEHYSF